MCRLQNIARRDYLENVTTGQTHAKTDAGQSDPYVPLCFAGDTKVGKQREHHNFVSATNAELTGAASDTNQCVKEKT